MNEPFMKAMPHRHRSALLAAVSTVSLLVLSGCTSAPSVQEPTTGPSSSATPAVVHQLDLDLGGVYYSQAWCPAQKAQEALESALQAGDLKQIQREARRLSFAYGMAKSLLEDLSVGWPQDIPNELPNVVSGLTQQRDAADELAASSTLEDTADLYAAISAVQEGASSDRLIRARLTLVQEHTFDCDF